MNNGTESVWMNERINEMAMSDRLMKQERKMAASQLMNLLIWFVNSGFISFKFDSRNWIQFYEIKNKPD